MTDETIPVIDIEKISEQFECKKLRDACEKWGCFRIINHSIPLTLMAEMRMVVEALHDLPMDIKKNNKDVISGRGYFAPSALNPLLESFGLYDMDAS
ncbi:putative non-heme dioxygenase domain, isopenicillin N synthase [Medicago truncatula]|uniref:Putative non-heme dioxygenase domain, isopenicillin N synthase n=1 Tax=Medicago truncatula TaxID=3880 RepID=A0A396HPX5_MEDTR|nr:putative non-heme dioxygenase domain, isopenicillin N synthase [Medicago truncatula]